MGYTVEMVCKNCKSRFNTIKLKFQISKDNIYNLCASCVREINRDLYGKMPDFIFCKKCSEDDQEFSESKRIFFCRCEDRNVRIAKEHRTRKMQKEIKDYVCLDQDRPKDVLGLKPQESEDRGLDGK